MVWLKWFENAGLFFLVNRRLHSSLIIPTHAVADFNLNSAFCVCLFVFLVAFVRGSAREKFGFCQCRGKSDFIQIKSSLSNKNSNKLTNFPIYINNNNIESVVCWILALIPGNGNVSPLSTFYAFFVFNYFVEFRFKHGRLFQ